MKICLTGASGFVGGHLLKFFLDQGLNTVCLVRPTSPGLDQLKTLKTEIRFADFSIPTISDSLFADIDIVFHLAGNVFGRNAKDLYKVNVDGTAALCRAIKNSSVRKFIFLSSIAAVGPAPKGQLITDEMPPNPISAYGRSKLLAEKKILEILNDKKIMIRIVRAPLIYGPGMSLQSRLANMVIQIKRGNDATIGDGENIISLCQVSTLVNFLGTLVNLGHAEALTLHISDPNPPTLSKLVEMACRSLGLKKSGKSIPKYLAYCIAIAADIAGMFLPLRLPLSRERVRELTAQWHIDLKRIQSLGFTPRDNWETTYGQTIQWISSRIPT